MTTTPFDWAEFVAEALDPPTTSPSTPCRGSARVRALARERTHARVYSLRLLRFAPGRARRQSPPFPTAAASTIGASLARGLALAPLAFWTTAGGASALGGVSDRPTQVN